MISKPVARQIPVYWSSSRNEVWCLQIQQCQYWIILMDIIISNLIINGATCSSYHYLLHTILIMIYRRHRVLVVATIMLITSKRGQSPLFMSSHFLIFGPGRTRFLLSLILVSCKHWFLFMYKKLLAMFLVWPGKDRCLVGLLFLQSCSAHCVIYG